MNIELLELAAAALGGLLPNVVFVGGATIELWITDPAAPPARVTNDVDVVVEVSTRGRFYAFEAELRQHGFIEDRESSVICRWRHQDSELILDAMPAIAEILGFENRWQRDGLPHAIELSLPSGTQIRAVSPPYLLATKLEAFAGRGQDDFVGSRDFEDVVKLLDGRAELVEEIHTAASELRNYLAAEATRLLTMPRMLDGLAGALLGDPISQQRADTVVLPALRAIASMG